MFHSTVPVPGQVVANGQLASCPGEERPVFTFPVFLVGRQAEQGDDGLAVRLHGVALAQFIDVLLPIRQGFPGAQALLYSGSHRVDRNRAAIVEPEGVVAQLAGDRAGIERAHFHGAHGGFERLEHLAHPEPADVARRAEAALDVGEGVLGDQRGERLSLLQGTERFPRLLFGGADDLLTAHFHVVFVLSEESLQFFLGEDVVALLSLSGVEGVDQGLLFDALHLFGDNGIALQAAGQSFQDQQFLDDDAIEQLAPGVHFQGVQAAVPAAQHPAGTRFEFGDGDLLFSDASHVLRGLAGAAGHAADEKKDQCLFPAVSSVHKRVFPGDAEGGSAQYAAFSEYKEAPLLVQAVR